MANVSSKKGKDINLIYEYLDKATISKPRWGHREVSLPGNVHCRVDDLIKKLKEEIEKSKKNGEFQSKKEVFEKKARILIEMNTNPSMKKWYTDLFGFKDMKLRNIITDMDKEEVKSKKAKEVSPKNKPEAPNAQNELKERMALLTEVDHVELLNNNLKTTRKALKEGECTLKLVNNEKFLLITKDKVFSLTVVNNKFKLSDFLTAEKMGPFNNFKELTDEMGLKTIVDRF